MCDAKMNWKSFPLPLISPALLAFEELLKSKILRMSLILLLLTKILTFVNCFLFKKAYLDQYEARRIYSTFWAPF